MSPRVALFILSETESTKIYKLLDLNLYSKLPCDRETGLKDSSFSCSYRIFSSSSKKFTFFFFSFSVLLVFERGPFMLSPGCEIVFVPSKISYINFFHYLLNNLFLLILFLQEDPQMTKLRRDCITLRIGYCKQKYFWVIHRLRCILFRNYMIYNC